jgi:hypothetical protein
MRPCYKGLKVLKVYTKEELGRKAIGRKARGSRRMQKALS